MDVVAVVAVVVVAVVVVLVVLVVLALVAGRFTVPDHVFWLCWTYLKYHQSMKRGNTLNSGFETCFTPST